MSHANVGPVRRKRQLGQATLETALTLLLLLLMITAVLDLGQLLMFLQAFSERARAGARWSAVNTYDPTAIKNYVVYNSANAPGGGGPGLLGLTPANVTVTRFNSGTSDDRIEVRISNFPLRFFTPFIAGTFTPRPFVAVIPVEGLGATN